MTSRIALAASLAALILSTPRAGSLQPSDPPAPTPGPEPRTALSTEATPGDADSIYHITQPGSYYLTGDVAGVDGSHGIKIEASDVTLDLMGFSVHGVPAAHDGIIVSAASLSRVTIRNGSVTGWGGSGMALFQSSDCLVENVTATDNTTAGIQVGPDSAVVHCRCEGNGGAGLVGGVRSMVSDVASNANLGQGMNIDSGASVSSCQINANGAFGLFAGDSCTVVDTAADDNGGDGISVDDASVVRGCHANSNTGDGIRISGGLIENCVASHNTGDGIEALGRTTIQGNSCDGNGPGAADGAGIHTTSIDDRIDGNTVTNNDRGIDVSGGINIVVRNMAAGNSTDYVTNANDTVGPIVTGPGTVASTSPWANFSF